MARTFVAASSQYVENATAIVTVAPFTISCWCNPTGIAGSGAFTLLNIGSTSTGNTGYFLDLLGTGSGGPALRCAAWGTGGFSSSTQSFAGAIWHHFAGVHSAVDNRIAYVDASAAVADTTSNSVSPLSASTIGAWNNAGTRQNYMEGLIAEAAIWDAALTAAEIAALAKGYSPFFVRPANMVSYWPMIGRTNPEIDIVGGNTGTVSGATAAPHPRIIMPTKSNRSIRKSAAAQLQFVGFMGTSGV